jgi:hypothetical protein
MSNNNVRKKKIIKVSFDTLCIRKTSIGCSFKFILKVGVEKSIVNALQITDHKSVF